MTVMFLAVIVVVLLPVTLLFWLTNVFLYSFYTSQNVWEPISPLRLLLAIFLPALIARNGLRKKSLSKSGAEAGFLVGLILTLSSYCFMASLLVFFLTGSKLTKWRSGQKRKLEADFKEGGQRNWLQVICNAGIASELSLLYLVDVGCSEFPIDFQKRYSASWLSTAVLGSLACSCGDTFASEIGSVVGKTDPWLVTTFQRVPRGTNGGISVVGLLSSVVGGAVTGLAYFVVLLLCANSDTMLNSHPQWPIVVLGGLCGLFGSLVDSLLGATLQYSGINLKTGLIVEQPSDNVQYISGVPLLDNHGVNLLSSVVTAFLAPHVALYMWSYFIPMR